MSAGAPPPPYPDRAINCAQSADLTLQRGCSRRYRLPRTVGCPPKSLEIWNIRSSANPRASPGRTTTPLAATTLRAASTGTRASRGCRRNIRFGSVTPAPRRIRIRTGYSRGSSPSRCDRSCSCSPRSATSATTAKLRQRRLRGPHDDRLPLQSARRRCHALHPHDDDRGLQRCSTAAYWLTQHADGSEGWIPRTIPLSHLYDPGGSGHTRRRQTPPSRGTRRRPHLQSAARRSYKLKGFDGEDHLFAVEYQTNTAESKPTEHGASVWRRFRPRAAAGRTRGSALARDEGPPWRPPRLEPTAPRAAIAPRRTRS
jgi:hypothetical protein